MESLIFPLLLALLFVPLLLSFRKQRRQYNEVQQLQRSLIVGDRVMTTSGAYGTVVALTDNTVDLEIAPGVITKWARPAVRERVNTSSGEADAENEVRPAESDDHDLGTRPKPTSLDG